MQTGSINTQTLPQTAPQNSNAAPLETAASETVQPPIDPVNTSGTSEAQPVDSQNRIDFLA